MTTKWETSGPRRVTLEHAERAIKELGEEKDRIDVHIKDLIEHRTHLLNSGPRPVMVPHSKILKEVNHVTEEVCLIRRDGTKEIIRVARNQCYIIRGYDVYVRTGDAEFKYNCTASLVDGGTV
jgi:hypothetical protein